MGLMQFVSVKNCKNLLDQICCPLQDMIVSKWRTCKILKFNVQKKSKELFHVSTNFLHLEKCLGLLESLVDTESINWIKTRSWKAQRNNIQSTMHFKMHPSIHQTQQSTLSKTNATEQLMKLFSSRGNEWFVTIHLHQCL